MSMCVLLVTEQRRLVVPGTALCLLTHKDIDGYGQFHKGLIAAVFLLLKTLPSDKPRPLFPTAFEYPVLMMGGSAGERTV